MASSYRLRKDRYVTQVFPKDLCPRDPYFYSRDEQRLKNPFRITPVYVSQTNSTKIHALEVVGYNTVPGFRSLQKGLLKSTEDLVIVPRMGLFLPDNSSKSLFLDSRSPSFIKGVKPHPDLFEQLLTEEFIDTNQGVVYVSLEDLTFNLIRQVTNLAGCPIISKI
jgi:hypothetical protein